MPLIQLVEVLIVVGVLLWLVDRIKSLTGDSGGHRRPTISGGLPSLGKRR